MNVRVAEMKDFATIMKMIEDGKKYMRDKKM